MDPTYAPPSRATEQSHPHHEDPHVHIFVISSVVPVCTIILVLLVIRRVILRRRTRINRSENSSIFVIADPAYQLRQFSQKNIPDIERVTSQKNIKKVPPKAEKIQKDKLVKNVKNKNKSPTATMKFPREPVYKSQQTPSYLVPFTALPPNFDFSLANVEVHSDFVIIKDLDILQTYWYESENTKEEYQKSKPYNPNFT